MSESVKWCCDDPFMERIHPRIQDSTRSHTPSIGLECCSYYCRFSTRVGERKERRYCEYLRIGNEKQNIRLEKLFGSHRLNSISRCVVSCTTHLNPATPIQFGSMITQSF